MNTCGNNEGNTIRNDNQSRQTFSNGIRAALVCLILFEPGCKPKEVLVPVKPASALPAEFPLPDRFPIVVPMKFRDVEYHFMLDTGCSLTSFNPKHRDLLGDYIKTYTTSGFLWQKIPVDAHAIPEEATMQLGPIRIKGEVGVMDYSALGDWLARYDGLVGIDIMGQFLVQFDFEKELLRFLRSDTRPDPNWGEPFDLELSGGTPHLRVRLTDSISEQFMIDTGAPLIYLTQEKFESLVREQDPSTSYVRRPITQDSKDLAGAIIRKVSLEPLIYDSIRIVESPRSFLGMEFLRRHSLVTLDCQGRKLYLKLKCSDPTPPSGLGKPPVSDSNHP